MPRKLPWATGGGNTKTHVKSAPVKRARIDPDSDDDFFSGTVLESSRKGKRGIGSPTSHNEFDELPVTPTTPSRKSLGKQRAERVPSSSPPAAVSDLPPPKIEYMREGVNRFELRDDEWMMVEDELLQTAKRFTQHLHLAEYERLKERIQTKKEVVRPVVPSAKPSDERKFQMRAENQAKAQMKALKDIQDDKHLLKPSSSRLGPTPGLTGSGSSSKRRSSETSDSEDLDAPIRPAPPSRATSSTPFAKPALPAASLSAATRSSRPSTSEPPGKVTDRSSFPGSREPSSSIRSSFSAKLATQTSLRSSPPTRSVTRTSGPSQTTRTRPSARLARSFNIFDDDDDFLKPSPLPKEHAERLAKRKAEKEKEEEAKRKKTIALNDIPTFLF
ncbi:uncharacterized protein EI97DRAFT_467409 [Westerdykella ornata]|uniref:Uncharacterized protein n=1 Tax=Westerdykella ornata TaxID=318751 RepID=A0A6A6JHP6_WESOR|nr:uncharacterized protein EI97DRAFT_467409 [Westerdykella ornata]KAF2276180.1 hypothetical protein EI97DRAFT_467409 [Westerdykella ornata]